MSWGLEEAVWGDGVKAILVSGLMYAVTDVLLCHFMSLSIHLVFNVKAEASVLT